MVWYGWLALAVILGCTGLLCAKLHDPKDGTVGCCGCGQCAHTGECVMTKKKVAKKEESPS